LQVDYFYSLTYRQFANTLEGYRRKEDGLSKERLIIMRKLSYVSLLPHLKSKVSEHEYMPFPWESDIIEMQNIKTNEEIEKEINEMKDFWARVDKARGKIPEC
jgi:hypothetical protein